MMMSSGGEAVCEKCGAPAHMHITSEWTGANRIRHLCFDCAEMEQVVKARRKRAFNLGAVFMVVGSIVVLVSLFADRLYLGTASGFGAWQVIGLALAVILTGIGAILRIPTIMAIGPCVGLVALLAHHLALGDTPGFGRQQLYGCLAGSVMILLGLAIVLLRVKWATRIRRPPAS